MHLSHPAVLAAILILPLLAVLIDGAAGLRARNRTYEFGDLTESNFRILVPIWGQVRYLTNLEYLSQYGAQVTLCTTGNETPEFVAELRQIADCYGFRVFIDDPSSSTGKHRHRVHTHKRRSTSGTIRDRLIRHALAEVAEPYVVPLDADTITRQHLSVLVGELVRRKLDLASIRLVVNNPRVSLLTRLQTLEYRLAMQMRFVAPWMVSGACHVARTEVLTDIMRRHSLFFQGNDVEIGVIAQARKYRVGHIPFEVPTDVPADFKSWLRQRLAWAGGEVRLFIGNPQLILKHPFFWFYGGVVTIIGLFFRWLSITEPSLVLIWALVLYIALALYLHWKSKSALVLIMPIYAFISSMVLTPLGIIWYIKMAVADSNWGMIRPNRTSQN